MKLFPSFIPQPLPYRQWTMVHYGWGTPENTLHYDTYCHIESLLCLCFYREQNQYIGIILLSISISSICLGYHFPIIAMPWFVLINVDMSPFGTGNSPAPANTVPMCTDTLANYCSSQLKKTKRLDINLSRSTLFMETTNLNLGNNLRRFIHSAAHSTPHSGNSLTYLV